MPHHDLIIVGSGSGNTLFTDELRDLDIALVEEETRWFGGTCLNVGCIPTKMFVYPAEIAAKVAEGQRLGMRGPVPQADWPQIRDRIFGRIDSISDGGRKYRAQGTPNGTLYQAHAEFTAPRTLALSTGETLTADRIVLAAGSRATVPKLVEDSGVPFHTSDTIMRLDRLPERLIILGGGYIAAEFAHVFGDYGSHVTVVSRSPLLREHDEQIADAFTEIVRAPWNLHLQVLPRSITEHEGTIRVELQDGSVIEGDTMLVATGRVANGDRLNAAAGGVDLHEDDPTRVVVDDYQRTTADGVWALGDVCSDYQLKHVANHEAKIVAHNLAHPEALRKSDHRVVPSAVFTHPQLASVGLTEVQAQDAGLDYAVKVQKFGDVAYGWAMEDTTGLCKVIADRATGKLVGAHLMGEQASVLLQPLVQAMSFGLGAMEMAKNQYWPHPALTEVVENALLGLDL